MMRRDIADDAVDAAVRRDGRLDLGKQLRERLEVVRLVPSLFPFGVKIRPAKQLRRVNLELIRAEAVSLLGRHPQTGEVFRVGFGCRAEKVRHPVQDNLESGGAGEGDFLQRVLHGEVPPIFAQNLVVQGLNAELHLRHAQHAEAEQRLRVEQVGAGLNDQSDVAVFGGLIQELGFGKRL